MNFKKSSIWQNPALPAAGIASLLSAVASNMNFDVQVMRVINAFAPPVSILLSYILVWLTAKFYTFSIPEQKALSRLKAREKLIRKELGKDGIPAKLKKELQQELDDIIRTKIQIGKNDNLADESDR